MLFQHLFSVFQAGLQSPRLARMISILLAAQPQQRHEDPGKAPVPGQSLHWAFVFSQTTQVGND